MDIKLGPDGALYIADFYNRIIGHYEVPLTHPGRDRTSGRIWRIVYKGTDGKAPPAKAPRADWTKATIAELDPGPGPSEPDGADAGHEPTGRARRQAAVPSIKILRSSSKYPVVAQCTRLWVMERLGQLHDQTLEGEARSNEPLESVHACAFSPNETN